MTAALDAGLLAYLAGGSESETALRRNRQALDALALVPRMLNDVSVVDGSVRFMGRSLAWPLLLAPVGSLHRLHADGIAGVRAAAERAGIAYAVGSALPGAQEVVASDTTAAFYQLYAEGGETWLDEQCHAAAERGFAALILTVDAPVFPVRPRDVDTGNHAAGRATDGTSRFRKALDWDAVARLTARRPALPVILKGLQDPRDAERAVEAGAAAIYLSNHGGRQYDQGPGIADLIRPMARAIAGRAPLIADGAFESGNDVLKALALGADLVGLGRAYLYPYAGGGRAGLLGYLERLGAQLAANMALLGASRLRDLPALRVLRDAGPPTSV